MILDVYKYKIYIKLIHDDASYFDWQPLTGLTINCNNDKKLQVNDPFFLACHLVGWFPKGFCCCCNKHRIIHTGWYVTLSSIKIF